MTEKVNGGSGGNAAAAKWMAATNPDGTPHSPSPVVTDGFDSYVLGKNDSGITGGLAESSGNYEGNSFRFGQKPSTADGAIANAGVGQQEFFTGTASFPGNKEEPTVLSEPSPLEGGFAKPAVPKAEEHVPIANYLETPDGRPVFKPVIPAKKAEKIVETKEEPEKLEFVDLETLKFPYETEEAYDPHDASYFKKGQRNIEALREKREKAERAQQEKSSFVDHIVGFFGGGKKDKAEAPVSKTSTSAGTESLVLNDPTDKGGERKPLAEAREAVKPFATMEELRESARERKISSRKPAEIVPENNPNTGGTAKPAKSENNPNTGGEAKPAPSKENNPNTGGTAKPAESKEGGNPNTGSEAKKGGEAKPTPVPAASRESAATQSASETSEPNPRTGGTAKPAKSENNPNTGGTAKPAKTENNPNTGGTAKPAPSENNPNTGGTAKPASSETQAAKPSTAAQERMERQVEENIREKIKERGGKVLGATEEVYLVATEGLTDKAAKKEAASIAHQAMVLYDERIKAERAAKANERAQRLMEQGKKQDGFLLRLAKNVGLGVKDRFVGTFQRSAAVKNYYKTALAAIEKTGKGSAGKLAVEAVANTEVANKAEAANKTRKERFVEMMHKNVSDVFGGERRRNREEAVKDVVAKDAAGKLDERIFNPLSDDYAIDKYGNIVDPDKAMIDRAVQARRSGALNLDKGVKLESQKDSPLTEALKTFAREVAAYDKSVDTDTEISREDFNKEMAKRDAARAAVAEAINKHLGGTVNNAAQVVRLIERNLGGTMTEELRGEKGAEAHKEALATIDDYISKHFHFDKFKVTDNGLAVDEGKANAKWTDVLTIKTNLGLGIAVGLGSTFAVGLAKSAVIQHITNSQIVMAGMKVAIATGVGFQRGYSKAKKEQVKENIDTALGVEKQGKNEGMRRKLGKDFTELMLNVDGAIEDLSSNLSSMNEEAKQAKVKDIAAILARLDLQDKHAGKVNLFVYNGRDKIERGKADMFKAMNDAIEALKASGMEASAVEKMIAASRAEQFNELSKAYGKIARNQFAWRMGRGAMTGALAGLTAAVTTIAWDKLKGGNKLEQEIRDLAQGKKKWEGLNVVDVEQAAAGGAIAEEVIQGGQEGDKKAPEVGGKENVKTPEQMEIERRSNSQVLIEESDNGGQSIGFDENRNGRLDDGEYLIGGGRERGVNLSNEADFAAANEKLRPYGVEMSREATIGQRNVPVTVSDYVNSQSNAVKGININQVNWNKSQQLVSIERDIVVHPNDGMELYEVPIDGKVPAGAKLYIDLDGDGPGAPLEYEIVNGKAIVPAGVLDTSRVGTGGTAKLLGTVRVAKIENNEFISYTTNTGRIMSGDSTLNSTVEETGYAISVVKHGANGEETIINQAAVDGNGHTVSNLSETFNGRATSVSDRVPYMMQKVQNPEGSAVALANGAVIEEYQYSGGYQEKFDASLNYMFKEKATYVGTPMTLDVNGDGAIDPTESAAYVNQMFVRTATNPYVLMQNASAYGVLEPEVMTDLGLTREVLARDFGIMDGQIDTMEELNAFLEKLKLSENADWYDKLVNRTLGTMRTDLAGAQFEVVTLGSREATYLNNGNSLDFIHASRNRTAVAYYKMVNGEKVYIGNKGFMYGKDNKEPAYDILACEQKGKRPPQIKTTPPVIRTTPIITTTPVIRTTPVITTTRPVITTTQPVITTTRPVITTTQPVITTTRPVITTTQPVITTTRPVITTTRPVITTTQPVITTTRPVITTTQPVITTTLPPKVTPKPMEPKPGDGKLPTPTPTTEPGQPIPTPGPITEEPGEPYVPPENGEVVDDGDIEEWRRIIGSRNQQQ